MEKELDVQKIDEINSVNVIIDEIYSARKEINVRKIRNLIKDYPVTEIIIAIEDLPIDLLIFFIKSLASKDVGQWFNYLSIEKQTQLINNLPNPDVQKVIEDLESDELVDMLDELPRELVGKIISLSSTDTRKNINMILSYKDNEAGSIMNTGFIELKSFWTIKQAINEIRTRTSSYEEYNVYYVTDKNDRLVGKTNLKQLFFEKNYRKRLYSLMQKDFVEVNAKQDLSEVAKIFGKFEKEAVPVVNNEGKIVGIISDNDIVDFIIRENKEDISKMHGVRDLRVPYLKASVFSIFKSRIFWLSILMVAATFTAIIIDKFQELGNYQTFGLSALFLVPIIPVITDTSGNAGGQASSSVIIAIAHGEVTPKEYRKVFWKELKVSLVIGMFLALLNFARLLVYYLAFDPKDAINRIVESNNIDLIVGQDQYIIFSTIVALGSSLSIFISVILSKILGGLLPVIAVKFRVDPAAMSNPVLTTILDTASMVVFFGIGVSVISAFVK